LLLGSNLVAQTETTYQTTEAAESIKKQHLVAIKDCFLCTYGEMKRAFRFGYGNLNAHHQTLSNFTFGASYLPSYLLEYEQKITTGFSINTQLIYTSLLRNTPLITPIEIANTSIYEYKSTRFRNTALSIEPRWYFNKKKEIRQGKSGDNLSGLYTGLFVSQNWWTDGKYIVNRASDIRGNTPQRNLTNKGETQVALVNIGWQKNFKDMGFFNFQLGTGISRNTQNITSLTARDGQIVDLPIVAKWKWLLNYQVTWGATLGKRKQLEKIPDNFLEYYEEAKDMWKIDLYNVFQGLNEKGAVGRLHLAYERKIKRSPFAIEGGLQYLYSQDFETKAFNNQLAVQVEPRFYYRLKKDISNGTGANNLSSMYVGLLNHWNIGGAKLGHFNKSYQPNLTWGFQERLFKHFFIDYRIGLGFGSTNEEEASVFHDFRLGFAF